jgi:ABC-type transporter Mla maintaining outer membrane lipid asymmetry permease subunit MlaE
MSLVKAGVFGFFIALMGCYHGFRSTGGAAGVGGRRPMPSCPHSCSSC